MDQNVSSKKMASANVSESAVSTTSNPSDGFMLNTAEELIHDIRMGKMVILMDDEDRENEGDLVMAAEFVRTEDINFMITHARGLVCLTLSEQRCQQLALPLMVSNNGSSHHTNFTLSIEATEGVTTGISAADRALTIKAAVARNAEPKDIVSPGHIFPLMAKPGGVLSRAGHTEAGCDLARLAGAEPASVIVEIMNPDGTMARRSDLEIFAREHDLKIGTIADLINYRLSNEQTVEVLETGDIHTDYGDFAMHTFRDKPEGRTHIAIVKGEFSESDVVPVRVQSSSTMRDLLCVQAGPDSAKRWNVSHVLQHFEREGKGVLVLLAADECEQSLERSIQIALGKADVPKPTTDGAQNAHLNYGIGSQILRHVGVTKMNVLGPDLKYKAISGFDLEIVGYIPQETTSE